MRCPFVYSPGRRCKGEIVEAWQKLFRTGGYLRWRPADDAWVEDSENDAVWDYACSRFGNPGPTSHIHVVCSPKGGHAGFMPDDQRMEVWDLPEEIRQAIRDAEK